MIQWSREGDEKISRERISRRNEVREDTKRSGFLSWIRGAPLRDRSHLILPRREFCVRASSFVVLGATAGPPRSTFRSEQAINPAYARFGDPTTKDCAYCGQRAGLIWQSNIPARPGREARQGNLVASVSDRGGQG